MSVGLGDEVGFGLALVGGGGDGTADLVLGVELYDDAVLAELLLDEDDLLHSLHDEVAARVVGALLHHGQLPCSLALQHAVARAQHDGHAADDHRVAPHQSPPLGVLHVHQDGRGVGHVTQTTLLRGDGGDGQVDHVLGCRSADADVGVAEEEGGVGVAEDLGVGGQDGLQLRLQKVVVRVDVLTDQAAHAQEGGQQTPLVLTERRGTREVSSGRVGG